MTRDRLTRWRLVLGSESEEAATGRGVWEDVTLGPEDEARDRALDELYGRPRRDRRGGLGASAPKVARWLGDIRTYFPTSVVQVMQQDAVDRLNLKTLLLLPGDVYASRRPEPVSGRADRRGSARVHA